MPASQRPGCIIFYFPLEREVKTTDDEPHFPSLPTGVRPRAFPEFVRPQGTTAWTGVKFPSQSPRLQGRRAWVMGATQLRWRAQPPATAVVKVEVQGAFDVDVVDP